MKKNARTLRAKGIKKNPTEDLLKNIFFLQSLKKDIEKELNELWKVWTNNPIKEQDGYWIKTTYSSVRKIDPTKFRKAFGDEVYFKVSTVPVTKAVDEVGNNKFEELDKKYGYVSVEIRERHEVVRR